MASRSADISRETLETRIRARLDLDGTGVHDLQLNVPFLEHMLAQIARHGLVDLTLEASGDTDIDDHHTVEDTGIVLGQAFDDALGERRGIRRYGNGIVPLDEALSRVVIDFSGRPGLYFHATFHRPRVGSFDVDLVREFFQGFVNHARCTLHVDCIRGDNVHHMIETIFKAFGRALREAVEIDPRLGDATPSTKGSL